MKRIMKKRVFGALFCLLAMLALLLPFGIKITNEGGRYAITASADSDDEIAVHKYDLHMALREDRKIDVLEIITVEFIDDDLTMFYRSLPTDGARYENIEATCEGNSDFSYYVADNEEVEGFIDVNCVGNAERGRVWTYQITYVMEQATNKIKDGMIIDVVGFGWQVPLRNVSVQIDFPQKPTSTKVYTDVFDVESGNVVTERWLNEKSLLLTADILDIVYSERYAEEVAGGITLQFTLPEGRLTSYTKTRLHTEDMWKIVLGSGLAIVLAVIAAVFLSKKKDLVTVVNLNPPDGMDPMKMGKWIDGAVNSEDITSMVYYFANKGYLKIDFTDEDDPKLITDLDCLPEAAPVYEKTLFNGLFNGASAWQEDDEGELSAVLRRAVKVSELEGKFFEASQTAGKQLPDAPPMYETKSIFAYLSGPIIGLILGFLLPFLISARIGGDYRYMFGVVLMVPLAANAVLGYVMENHRYKWKLGKRIGLVLAQIAIALLFTLVFIFAIAEHVMTEYEKLALCIGIFAASFITSASLVRSDAYLKVLEDILGFKEFIVVTEEDKIKVMLEENPELYYKVLPYAQVLGVTDEWEGKFKKLLVEPPSWYVGADLTYFDCYILHRCLNRSVAASMARAAAAAANNGAGRFVGRSGGGGSFGGFGGGGFGGGGGGAR